LPIVNAYCNLNDIKTALRIFDTIDDANLERAINSASRLVDGYCQRSFYKSTSAETRHFVATNSNFCEIDDLVSVTWVKTSEFIPASYTTVWDADDYQLNPLNNRVAGVYAPYNSISAVGTIGFPISGDTALVEVKGIWGFSEIPDPVAQATIIQASRIFKRLDSPLGVLGMGDLGVVRIGTRLDPDVAQLLENYRLLRINA
jgi:hypothetical protein